MSRLDRALAWLDTLAPDVLVLSSDLIDNDEIEGYPAIAARLARRPYPAYVLPGNADNRAAIRAAIPAPYWNDGGRAGSAAGQVETHLPWLQDALSPAGPAASIVFLHHPVFPIGIAPLDRTMCGGAEALGTLLRHHPRRPLAMGHVHWPAAGTPAGIPAFLCGSICPANPLWFGRRRYPRRAILPL
ncbi:3',5'-cyclic adenosine monophosphate phosphodiesterase CpdA [Sodalis glossinidius str. 'morsitans']|uniref:3',5'-cyclic adenosine monophosphate phosphodiesterase CpdA n=1 Tax=Sodalis glossinidius (strain morsitans) TaxID=343509 RepID=Q2NUL0_SODGM|nr:hypothetical protein SG0890 [Sodalis glossinidius str. 'morsitans']CRL44723.1 3',5'-cyclic adenosine monophosphate phosphodiesterase CpdA [Sodalis glossinidius str. 'morsitans']